MRSLFLKFFTLWVVDNAGFSSLIVESQEMETPCVACPSLLLSEEWLFADIFANLIKKQSIIFFKK